MTNLIKRILSSIILITIVIFFILKDSYLFDILLIICFLASVYEWFKMNKNHYYKLYGLIFLIFSFYSFYKIKFTNMNDYSILLFILIICISTDIGGFVFGKIFKGIKLTKISPNKTYSGVLGSYIFSLLSVLIFFKITNGFFIKDIAYLSFFLVILLSTISQIGDLTISYFKRKSNINNTGNIIPGHGGILDRIDGMIFVFPFSYVLIKLDIFIL